MNYLKEINYIIAQLEAQQQGLGTARELKHTMDYTFSGTELIMRAHHLLEKMPLEQLNPETRARIADLVNYFSLLMK